MLTPTSLNSLFFISVLFAFAALLYSFGGQILKDLKMDDDQISNENSSSKI